MKSASTEVFRKIEMLLHCIIRIVLVIVRSRSRTPYLSIRQQKSSHFKPDASTLFSSRKNHHFLKLNSHSHQ